MIVGVKRFTVNRLIVYWVNFSSFARLASVRPGHFMAGQRLALRCRILGTGMKRSEQLWYVGENRRPHATDS